jgi:Luciferase
MMKHLKRLEDEVSTWPNISIHPHRFGGREFRVGSAEVGHVHTGGIVDIPSLAQFAMLSSRRVWPKSTAGFPTQAGLLSEFAVKTTSSVPSGSCVCHTCVTH